MKRQCREFAKSRLSAWRAAFLMVEEMLEN
jgi:hypothetical protein